MLWLSVPGEYGLPVARWGSDGWSDHLLRRPVLDRGRALPDRHRDRGAPQHDRRNTGFALYADSPVGYATDPWIIVPISPAFVVDRLGFPVIFEAAPSLRRQRIRGIRRRRWSLHTRITLITYALLSVVGVVAVIAFEWANPGTLGPLGTAHRLPVGGFRGIVSRTAGFNSLGW